MICFVYGCERDAEYEVRVRSLRNEWDKSSDYFVCDQCYNMIGNELNLDYEKEENKKGYM